MQGVQRLAPYRLSASELAALRQHLTASGVSPATLEAWRRQPERADAALHAEFCSSRGRYQGYAEYLAVAGLAEDVVCPVCSDRQQTYAVQQQIRRSGVPERYVLLELADLSPLPVHELVKRCMRQPQKILRVGESLILYGLPGSGKTQAAVLMMKAMIRAGYRAELVNMGRLALELRSSGFRGEGGVLERLGSCDFLVVDDVGAGESKSHQHENTLLYLVLEERHNRQLPTVFTTNLAPKAFVAALGERLLNRLMPVKQFEVKGKNFRLRETEVSVWIQ